jgi:isoleucyl-tRNA synthetase
MLSSAVKAGELLFSEKGVAEVLRNFHLPLWNAYSFLVTYSLVDNWHPDKDLITDFENPLDIWIISYTEKLVKEVGNSLDEYDFQKAIRALYKYLDELTNWYIRRSRRRFWKSENDLDKNQAYSALYLSILKFCITASPIAPFLPEELYQNLKTKDLPESIHLCDYPVENKKLRNNELEKEMELIQRTVEMGRSIRSKVKINLRKPLNAVHLTTTDKDEKKLLLKMEYIIKEELNVKNVVFEEEEEKLVILSCKPNFKVLGKKIGKHMKQASGIIFKFGKKEINQLEKGESINIEIDNNSIELTQEDILIERNEKPGLSVINEGTLTVALDTNLTKKLIEEGIARQFIRHIQNLRKDKDLNVTDRINIFYQAPKEINEALINWQNIIKQETLALELIQKETADIEVNVDEINIKIGLEKK